ncbi:g9768 [Coccomyxa viridis]|uniref:G9768 protein n=1 Tax=Coccomyxa viridis TaxID=1274662 RepID=A0ABP1G3U5_9CHLO
MPLHLLEIADVITAYLQDHPTSEVLSRGQRWVHLKRSSRAVDQGGIALVDIRAQLTAFQAKIIGRLLEPEHIAWNAFFDSWLSMPLTAGQILSTSPQQQHIWQLGRYLPSAPASLMRQRG